LNFRQLPLNVGASRRRIDSGRVVDPTLLYYFAILLVALNNCLTAIFSVEDPATLYLLLISLLAFLPPLPSVSDICKILLSLLKLSCLCNSTLQVAIELTFNNWFTYSSSHFDIVALLDCRNRRVRCRRTGRAHIAVNRWR
ncbi:hypothetical protein K469DRAFT_778670, partial [Zopfia rhizophila CBS 207.26]